MTKQDNDNLVRENQEVAALQKDIAAGIGPDRDPALAAQLQADTAADPVFAERVTDDLISESIGAMTGQPKGEGFAQSEREWDRQHQAGDLAKATKTVGLENPSSYNPCGPAFDSDSEDD